MVLDGCSADFPSGRRTVLWGRSGTGKSTLLTAIAGLLVPRSGAIALGSRVFFSSADGIDLPPYDRRVGFVFQDLALWPHLSAIDHVLSGGPYRRPRSRRCTGTAGVRRTRRSRTSTAWATVGWRTAAPGDCPRAGGPAIGPAAGRAVFVCRSEDEGVAVRRASRGLGTRPRTDHLRDASRRRCRQPGRHRDDARGRATRACRTSVGGRVNGVAQSAWRALVLGVTLFGVEAAAQEPTSIAHRRAAGHRSPRDRNHSHRRSPRRTGLGIDAVDRAADAARTVWRAGATASRPTSASCSTSRRSTSGSCATSRIRAGSSRRSSRVTRISTSTIASRSCSIRSSITATASSFRSIPPARARTGRSRTTRRA